MEQSGEQIHQDEGELRADECVYGCRSGLPEGERYLKLGRENRKGSNMGWHAALP